MEKEKINKVVIWIIIGLLALLTLGVYIKIFNSTVDVNPYIHKIHTLESKIEEEKQRSDSISKQVKKWEDLYVEESKKPKKIIKIINEKLDSIKYLSLDSSISYFQHWTKQPVARIPE